MVPAGDRLLVAQNLSLWFGKTRALAGTGVEVCVGQILVLTGRSGSGKSSLLYCLAGVVRPDRGKVVYRETDLTALSDQDLSRLRSREFGFVFQFGELVPELSIRENMALPLLLKGQSRRATRESVNVMLERLGIDAVADRLPGEVSGGQAQRAAVGRALIHHPTIVFADEPTGALDTESSEVVLGEFIDLARTSGAAVVIVTHEPSVAAIADRHLLMVDGTVRAAISGS